MELGLQDKLYLGNLDAVRDWGHARDYVEGMWMIVQQDNPDDYVLATGERHSVREFVEKAFACIDRSIEWHGSGVDEKGLEVRSGQVLIEVDARYFRPTEVDLLVGDPSKAQKRLGWRHKTSFDDMVKEMVTADLRAVRDETERKSRPLFDLAGKRVYVAGHGGMVGAALLRRLRAESSNILTVHHAELDLTRQAET